MRTTSLFCMFTVLACVSTAVAQTRPADERCQVFSLKDQGDLIVYRQHIVENRGEHWDGRYLYRVYFHPRLGERMLVAEQAVYDRSGSYPPDFSIKAAAVNGSEVVIVANSRGVCRAIVTRPTDGGPEYIAPRPATGKFFFDPDENTLGGLIDTAAIATRLGRTTVTITRGVTRTSYTLRTQDGGINWVKAD